ncbi:alanine--glyoxylate aminotransferase family protein [Dactylosporangium sp. NPDC051484]|uniref:pyridoxal-phosphate-dependent aminotransferase family protein n=1 Tax=Dactylosporangium sp. NPDC051484 TaxID=3154942 RepID=UPI003450634B
MRSRYRLMVPGPTAAPPQVLAAGALPVFDERIPRFAELYDRVLHGLRHVFLTEGDVLLFTSSMTGAFESVVQNVFSPGDRVLVANNGYFAQRWVDMCRAFRLDVVELTHRWGEAVDNERVADTIARDPAIVAAVGVHCETSTGALSDMEAFGAATKTVVSIVDSASSLGADELRTKDWGLDVVIGGGQKALMTPAGLSFVAVSERAWNAHERATGARFYFDWTATREAIVDRHATPFTPPVSLVVQLDQALAAILDEGLDAVWRRHSVLCAATRAAVSALGLEHTVAAAHASGAVTGARLPETLDARLLVAHLLERYGVQITAGIGADAARTVRIGHCGWVDGGDVVSAVAALEQALADLGHQVTLGAGVAAAQRVLAGQEVLR